MITITAMCLSEYDKLVFYLTFSPNHCTGLYTESCTKRQRIWRQSLATTFRSLQLQNWTALESHRAAFDTQAMLSFVESVLALRHIRRTTYHRIDTSVIPQVRKFRVLTIVTASSSSMSLDLTGFSAPLQTSWNSRDVSNRYKFHRYFQTAAFRMMIPTYVMISNMPT